MANACCINAFDKQGTIVCTLGFLKSEDIGQDIACKLPDVGNAEVDYILYTDKCGCCCCLTGENEIIIHTTQGEIKTLTASSIIANNSIGLNWSELYGGNWYKTMIRYKTGSYPTGITDGILATEEYNQNTYCVNKYCIPNLTDQTTYYIKAFALDSGNNIIGEKCISHTTSFFATLYFGCTGNQQTTVLQPGTYKIEVWGAQGGNTNGGGVGGKGGYTSGCITLTSATTLYIYVGGQGTGHTGCTAQAGGYNGGGQSVGYNDRCQASGGGATDIRIGGTSYYHRVIVAGGGGGAGGGGSGDSYNIAPGGYGGGTTGGTGSYVNSSYQGGYGGSQTSGGSNPNTSNNTAIGGFGYGGYKTTICGGWNAGGGGSGRYGGGPGTAVSSAGGGGSGYAWTSSSCSCHPAPACLSGIPYISNPICCCGLCNFPTATGGSETGHTGHGCVKISKP